MSLYGDGLDRDNSAGVPICGEQKAAVEGGRNLHPHFSTPPPPPPQLFARHEQECLQCRVEVRLVGEVPLYIIGFILSNNTR